MIYPADSAIQLSEQLGSELPTTGLTVGAHQQLKLDLRLWTTYCRMENTADIIYEIINIKAQGLSVNNRELKQRRGQRQRERQTSNRFRLEKQQLCTCITLFLYISLPSLPYYNVKVPKFTFCRGREHKTTTFFFFSWTLIQSFRIQLQKPFANIWRSKRDGISAIKFEAAPANSLLKWWRFRSRRCCLSSLI